jgi:hypothetical protein
MTTNELPERSGRETRLLVLIVVVSLAVLMLLARFRFPAATLTVAPPAPSPLANLAGRAAFEDLAESMSTLFGRVSSRLTVVRLDEPAEAGSARGRGGRGETPAATPVPPRLMPALRVRQDMALVHVPEGLEPASFLGRVEPIDVVAADPRRAVALVRTPMPAGVRTDAFSDGFAGFNFLGVVGATPNGPTVRPVFVGRVGLLEDDRWPAGLISTGDAAITAGSFLFSVEGRLVGLVVDAAWGTAIVPPSVIEAVVVELLAAAGSGS